MSQTAYTVAGMTCGHCASSVTEEVGKLVGVQTVDVDLAASKVIVTSDQPLADDDVRDAVTEAGYQLVS
jgi:copper chaperone